MRKQRRNIEQWGQKLVEVIERIQPDETAKARMYQQILQRAAVPKEAPVPKRSRRWLIPLSSGLGTAALACAVVLLAGVHQRLPQDGTQQLAVVPAVTTPQMLPEESPVVIQTETAPIQTTAVTAGAAATASVTTTAAHTHAIDKAVQPGTAPAVVSTTPVQTVAKSQAVTTQTAKQPAVTTIPVQTTVAVQTGTWADISAQTLTTQTTATEHGGVGQTTEEVPIRQNIYLYYKLTWDGMPYDTAYQMISGDALGQYLGYGVTRGADVDDTFTVLIYTIEGVDPSEQLAVQYAGEVNYYIFNVQ